MKRLSRIFCLLLCLLMGTGPALAEGVEAPAWPFEWKQIDKQKVLERTYASFSTHGGCCAAVVAALLPKSSIV